MRHYIFPAILFVFFMVFFLKAAKLHKENRELKYKVSSLEYNFKLCRLLYEGGNNEN